MCLTRKWLPPRSTLSRSHAPIPRPKSRSIFASTKATPANRLIAKSASAATRLMSRARATKIHSRRIVAANLDDGKWNVRILGSTAPGGF
jgi:hypothetical protein